MQMQLSHGRAGLLPMVIRAEPLPMPQLLPAAARAFAVLDLETTGTGQLCRIVEIVVLLLSPDGAQQQEWSTMIDPGVPIPNAAALGIGDALAASAPSFMEVVPELVALLLGHQLHYFRGKPLVVLVGHVRAVEMAVKHYLGHWRRTKLEN